jgi:hypothetical protein
MKAADLSQTPIVKRFGVRGANCCFGALVVFAALRCQRFHGRRDGPNQPNSANPAMTFWSQIAGLWHGAGDGER